MALAVLAGAKLYEWMGNTEDKSADLAKKMKEHSKENLPNLLVRLSGQAIRLCRDSTSKNITKTKINREKEYQNYIKGIAEFNIRRKSLKNKFA